MLKTGVYNLAQINAGNFKTILGGDKRISVTLYEKILTRPDAEQLAERILLLFTDERGAYKRTYSNRFAEFDMHALEIITKHFAKDQILKFHDAGISDGRTAVDLFVKLALCHPNIEYQASDYNPFVYVIEKDDVKITLSHNDKVIEIVRPPFVFNAANPDVLKYHALNRVVQFFVERLYVKPMLREYHAGKLKRNEIYLFCPAAVRLMTADPRFKLMQHNILNALNEKQHIIRAMNLLNVTYFSTAEFKMLLNNVYNALHVNGLFIVGSNQDSGSQVHGGIYRKTNSGFMKLWQSGKGSAVDHLIMETR